MQQTTAANTFNFLQQQFPNLEWKGYKRNNDLAHSFLATFPCGQLVVEVFPIGCQAILTIGNQLIAKEESENINVELVVSAIRCKCDAIARSLSSEPHSD